MLLSVVTGMFTASCTSGVEDVFDKPAAERVADAISEDMQVLTSATNGWKMEYYAMEDYGGYNVLCKFNADSTATVESDKRGPGQSYTSHFKIDQSQGVILSFDEYNPIFHLFSDPGDPLQVSIPGKGMEGDFEFRVMSVTQDTIVLKGKKHEQTIVMSRLADNFNWDDFLGDVATTENNMSAGVYNMVIGGDTLRVTPYYRSLNFVDPATGNTIMMPYIQTPTGFQLKDTLNYAGKVITGFAFSGDGIYLNPADPTVKLLPVTVPIAQQFVNGLWYIKKTNLGEYAQPYWDIVDEAAEATGYPLNEAMFGNVNFSSGLKFGLMFDGGDGYYGMYTYDCMIVSDDEVALEFNGRYTYGGLLNLNDYGFIYGTFPFGYDSRTFKLTTDNVANPSYVTLTDESDPTNVITLSASEVPYQ